MIPAEAIALRDELGGWPTGEPLCFGCLDSSHDHACLSEDEFDRQYVATFEEAKRRWLKRLKESE